MGGDAQCDFDYVAVDPHVVRGGNSDRGSYGIFGGVSRDPCQEA
jgi:hypothetical protein